MLRTHFILLFTLLAAVTASGRTVDVRPGDIAAGAGITGHEEVLTITGSLDASDLDRLADCIIDVTTLDLSGVEITAYKGARIGANITTAPAATLPTGIFAGLRVKKLILPATLTAIGDGALMGSAISEISVPESVTAIGRNAFAGCASLRSIALPQSLTVIPDGMAEGCGALTSVTVPAGVSRIGGRAFFGCGSLTAIDWPEALTELGEESFALSGIAAADLSRCTALTTIGARAFAHCHSLAAAKLPGNAAGMGQGVFFECKTLTTVCLPVSAVTVPPLTLKGADQVSALELPARAEVIDTLALAGASRIATLTLPSSLSHIADGAFENCTGLVEIDGSNLPAVPTLGDAVWVGVNQPDVRLTVAKTLENDFLTAPQWQDFSIRYTGILSTTDGRDGELTAAFEGMILTVTSTLQLSTVELFSTDGRLLISTAPEGDTSVALIDTSAFAGPFFIVRVTAQCGSLPATFKLLRQP
ncbi:MAG: leucine-rich repeat domain-containing protein [Duncaniella sp.]|nr:leucine-rich repeat domain-containing protein [Duncaniella sp.]